MSNSRLLIENKLAISAGTRVALIEKELRIGMRFNTISHIAIEEFFNGRMPAISFFSRIRKMSKKIAREQKRKKRMGEANDLRQQVIFRLWPEDHAELRAYLTEKGISLQLFAETITKAFIAGDPLLERLVEREQNRRIRAKKKGPRYSVEGLMDDIYEEGEGNE